MAEYADIRPADKIVKIAVPDLIAEDTGIQGFVFSRKFLDAPDLKRFAVPKTEEDKRLAIAAATKAWRIAEESDGGPGVGENYVRIAISDSHANAGSRAERLILYFGGQRKFLRLWGLDVAGERFPRGRTLQWDMSVGSTDPANWIETVPTNAWDDLLLVNESGDGILIDNIKIVHSSTTLVDWPPAGQRVWLDGSRGEKYGMIGLADQILQTKLEAITPTLRWVPQLHWAVLELGKTDGTKYGTTHDWCSEFASWCLRKAGWWDSPRPARLSDNIGSGDMQNYFDGKRRMYTQAQLTGGQYVLTEGDYLRFDNHSALFVRYEDDGRARTDPRKRFVSIDGNWGATVTLVSGERREIRDLISVGCTR